MYVYVENSGASPFTVGFYGPDGEWIPESGHGDRAEAVKRVAYLNGALGNLPPPRMAPPVPVSVSLEQARDPLTDEEVWLRVYCSVAQCFNSERGVALKWADEGLAKFKEKFR